MHTAKSISPAFWYAGRDGTSRLSLVPIPAQFRPVPSRLLVHTLLRTSWQWCKTDSDLDYDTASWATLICLT